MPASATTADRRTWCSRWPTWTLCSCGASELTGRAAPAVVVLSGPTAVGKTEVALALADRLPVSLISMDSAMVYRGMDIGTAKPPAVVLARYPHALVDIRDPADPYSAADFLADADAAVRGALAGHRLPVLVGGTMLYQRVFRDGLAELPPADEAVRAAILCEADSEGWSALYDRLARVDPDAAAAIHPNNHVRVQRALEVHRLTGTPISRFWSRQAGTSAAQRLGVQIHEFAIMPARRADLAGPIRTRFEVMLGSGFVDEVAALRARDDLGPGCPSMRAVGYRQVWAYLDGAIDHATLIERGAAATRVLAKKQFTWLKSWNTVQHLPAGRPRSLAERIALMLEIS